MERVDGQGINNKCLVGFDQAIVRNLLAIRQLHSTLQGGSIDLFRALALDEEVKPDGMGGRNEHQRGDRRP